MHTHSSPCQRMTSRAQNHCLEEEQVVGNAVCTYGCFLILLLPAQCLQSKDCTASQHLPAPSSTKQDRDGCGSYQRSERRGERRTRAELSHSLQRCHNVQ